MSDPIVKAVRGSLILAPTDVENGGALLEGMDLLQPLRLVTPHGIEFERHGLERYAVRAVALVSADPIYLLVPAKGSDVETLKLLFAAITLDGLEMVSRGDPSRGAAEVFPSTTAVMRPADTSEDYWYMPRLQLHTAADPLLNINARIKQLAESSLVLLCSSPDGSDLPEVGISDPDTLNTLYGLGAPPPP